MGLIGTLLSFVRNTIDGSQVPEVTLDPGGGDNVTAPHFGPPGLDSRPLPGDEVAAEDSTGTGQLQVTGYNDPKNAGEADAGEARLYSRDSDAVVKAVVWVKKDGTTVIENGSGTFEMAPSGDVVINGVTIKANGDIDAPGALATGGTITATGDVVTNLTFNALSTHVHPTAPLGPVSPPTPGT